MREEKVEEDWQSPVVRSEETLNVSRESVSSAEGGDAKSFQTGVSSLDFTDKGLRSSGSSVGSHVSRGHEPEPDQERCNDTAVPAEYSDTGAVNDQAMAHHSDELSFSDKCAAKEEQSRPFQPQEHCSTDQVPELPLLQTASPARPEPALDLKSPSSHASLPGLSHDSSASTRGQDKHIPAETAKTLDSLVSLVVHSWEHDFSPILQVNNKRRRQLMISTRRTARAPRNQVIIHLVRLVLRLGLVGAAQTTRKEAVESPI